MAGGAGIGKSAARVFDETLIKDRPRDRRMMKERFTAFISEILLDQQIISWGRLQAFRA
jgi:hypothetical protein